MSKRLLKQTLKQIDREADLIEVNPIVRILITNQLRRVLKENGIHEYNKIVYQCGLEPVGYKIIL